MFVDHFLAKKMFRFLIFIVYIAIDVTNVGLDLARKCGANEVKTQLWQQQCDRVRVHCISLKIDSYNAHCVLKNFSVFIL